MVSGLGVGRSLCSCRMESIRRSYKVTSFGGGGLRTRFETGTSGGRERIKSRLCKVIKCYV